MEKNKSEVKSMMIENALKKDISAIRRLLQENDLPTSDILDFHTIQFFVIREKGQIIAVVGLEVRNQDALLRSLAVNQKYKLRGLASQLLNYSEDLLRSQKIRSIYLLTTTARDFFAKYEFMEIDRKSVPKQISRTTEFSSLCPDTAICMHKNLNKT
jgi:amino-acid N-acetyltransferase